MKILYLEDNPADAGLAYRHLVRHAPHLQVTIAASLKQAREYLQDKGPWDLALVDLKLPDGSGLDFLLDIRRKQLPMAVVILTGTGDESAVINLLKAGADDYVIKGDHLDHLPVVLENAMAAFQKGRSRRSNTMRLFYLGDHPEDIELTRRHLATHAPHLHMEVVDTPGQLLDRLQPAADGRHPCDVVVMDYPMTGLKVLEMLKSIREERRLDVPVVLMTSQGSEAEALQALKLGASDLLVKQPGYRDILPKVLEIACQQVQLKREKAALDASEERFREIFLNMHDSVAIYEVVGDGEDFIFQQINPAGAKLVDIDPETVVGCSVKKVFPGIHDMGLLAVFQDVWRTGRPRRHPVSLYADNRVQMWVENYVCRLGTGNLVAIYRDMTAKKQAEDRLRESEQILKTVVDTTPTGVYVKDENGKYLLANKAIGKLCGIDRAAFIGADDADLARRAGISEADARRFAEGDRAVIATRRPVGIGKSHLTRRDGSTRWYLASKVPVDLPGRSGCVLGIAADITDQVAAEEHQALLYTAIEQSPETIIITDREGTIKYVNPAFETISGYSREAAIGRNPRFLKSGDHDDAFYREMWATLMAGNTWHGQIVNRRKDGTRFTERATISPVRSRGGKVLNFVAVKRDISSELETERRLHQAQKMEAIGTLAGGIAHDFNNILTSAIGYTELALEMVDKESRLRDFLKEIHISGMRARDLVAQILTFARRSEQVVQPVKVASIVKEMIKLLRASIPSSIDIRTTIDSNGKVLADPTQVHQVLMNLCTNAVQAMEANGGVLEIGLAERNILPSPEPREGAPKPGRHLELIVADTGQGIPPENMDAIFEPYFTTKGIGEGTGLGLSVVHGIVSSYGGEVLVESQTGRGTRFTVRLPISDDGPAPTETAAVKALPTGSEHLLVVDDEQVITNMLKQTLSRVGYRVTTRTSSVEALALFRSRADQFDLVITDMTMPNMTGDLLAAEMLKQKPSLPVILCTGFSKKISDEAMAAIGIKAVAMKPFSSKEIVQLVRRILDAQDQ